MKFSLLWRVDFLESLWDRSHRLLFEPVGRLFYKPIISCGDFLLFLKETLHWLLRAPFRAEQAFKQMEFIGVKSITIIGLTALFTGMVFALQTGHAFAMFKAEIFVGSTVGLALTREIAPVFTSLMVIARAGSAMAAEIGTMQVTEQVDALRSMAVDPIEYLVVPRMIAGTLMVPILSGLFVIIGIFGARLVAVNLLMIDESAFMHYLEYYVDMGDVCAGLIKAAVFGFLLSLQCSWCGYKTTGGAEGVGHATTTAVVLSSVTILISDYFLTSWIIEYFPKF